MNDEIKKQIMIAASNSFVGQMKYNKFDRQQNRLITQRYKVVPLDCNMNSAHNQTLYASDYEQHSKVKMFLINRIQSFVSTKRRVRTLFPVKLDNLRRYFGDIEENN